MIQEDKETKAGLTANNVVTSVDVRISSAPGKGLNN